MTNTKYKVYSIGFTKIVHNQIVELIMSVILEWHSFLWLFFLILKDRIYRLTSTFMSYHFNFTAAASIAATAAVPVGSSLLSWLTFLSFVQGALGWLCLVCSGCCWALQLPGWNGCTSRWAQDCRVLGKGSTEMVCNSFCVIYKYASLFYEFISIT